MEKLILFILILLESIILSMQDIKTNSVSESIIFFGIVFSLIFQLFFENQVFFLYILSSILSGSIYLLVKKITKKIGNGDILFGFFQGCIVLPRYIFIYLFIESIFPLFILLLSKNNKKIAFIPYMSLGLVGAFVFSVVQ